MTKLLLPGLDKLPLADSHELEAIEARSASHSSWPRFVIHVTGVHILLLLFLGFYLLLTTKLSTTFGDSLCEHASMMHHDSDEYLTKSINSAALGARTSIVIQFSIAR